MVTQPTELIIADWLRQASIPVQHTQAYNGFTDLQPLKPLLQDARVVGLGEATHGTREFFQFRHRLIEFLVTEMGFNVIALEASFSACQPINEFILNGIGDRATVLTGQRYVVWDTEEKLALLDWLRTYNQSVPVEKRVTFHGLDVSYNGFGRHAVLEYLRKVSPDRVPTTTALFEILVDQESKGPTRIDEETEKILANALPDVQSLIDHFELNRQAFIDRSSLAEYYRTLRFAEVIKQWVMSNTASVPPPVLSKHSARTAFMGDNLSRLVDEVGPKSKIVVIAHNGHIDLATNEAHMGLAMREKLGRNYFAIGSEFYQGSFHTRLLGEDKYLGDLKVVTLPPAPVGSLPWYLAGTNLDMLILNLHTPVGDPEVAQWLDTPRAVHSAGWVYRNDSQYYTEQRITDVYDAVMFFNTTTPTRPTQGAVQTISKHEGL